ncbi:MAG: dienelactone hydrolase family protein, partial [Casimicrobiaceae bacterium]
MITVPAGDREIAAFRAQPAGDGPFPLILVIEEIFGLHNWIKAVCRRLAGAGY